MVLLLHIGYIITLHGIKQLALTYLLAMTINYYEHLAVREHIGSLTVLVTLFPTAFKTLAIRVVEGTRPITIIILELTIVDLPIRPKEPTLPLLLSVSEGTLEDSAIRPVVKALAVHAVLVEHALVDFAEAIDATAVAVGLAIDPVAFVEGFLIMYLNAPSIRSFLHLLNVALVNGTARSRFPIVLEDPTPLMGLTACGR